MIIITLNIYFLSIHTLKPRFDKYLEYYTKKKTINKQFNIYNRKYQQPNIQLDS